MSFLKIIYCIFKLYRVLNKDESECLLERLYTEKNRTRNRTVFPKGHDGTFTGISVQKGCRCTRPRLMKIKSKPRLTLGKSHDKIESESKMSEIRFGSFSWNSCVLFMYCAKIWLFLEKKVSLLIKRDNGTDNKDFFLPVIPVISKTETSPSNNGNNSWHDICYIT